ncbi:MAG: Xaa-Pro peptidase family protein [Clostridia bacterium]|jgi:Xaa-Pro aminopeptidase|nr:Xaa-Pro peptidase family protein [Clostridia bacterium]MDH7573382.1 Xaa-Pro peptidase family protein [Clostridia bacterium]
MGVPAEELASRIGNLQAGLAAQGVTAAVIIQRLDLYYYAGTVGLDYLVVPAAGEPLGLARHNPYEPGPWRTEVLRRREDLAGFLLELVGSGGRLGLELDVLPARVYLRLAQELKGYTLVDVSARIRRQRAVKSAWELEVLRATARKDLAVWSAVPDLLGRARTDLELAAAIEATARCQGHQGLIKFRAFNEEIYFSSVLAGPDGALPGPWDTPLSGKGVSPTFPQGTSGTLLRAGEPILIDYGGCYQGYVVDQSRLFARGYLPQDLRRGYEVAREIQEAVIETARPGVACGTLYEKALRLAEQAGLSEFFMGARRVPFIGHGVGLELDEWPVLARNSPVALEPGMVFALEPKFAFPGRGAVGLENCYAVTPTGVERLTLATDDLIIV